MDGDVTSSLSGNAIIGRSGKDEGTQETKMLLFNGMKFIFLKVENVKIKIIPLGLYFRGEWEQPFTPISENMKFQTPTKEQMTPFMMAEGNFKYADVRSKQLIAVEFPYKNEKYSLMIVMPDTFKDLKYLSKSSDFNSFNEISAQLESTDIRVIIPKFRVEFTSKADKALGQVRIRKQLYLEKKIIAKCFHSQLGLKSIFSKNSDLRGISKDAEGFHIDELVQHVAIKIDEAGGSSNSLSGKMNTKFESEFVLKHIYSQLQLLKDKLVVLT